MNEDVLDLIKSLGVGCRHPKDEFFREGDQINKVHKIFGIHEVDDEEFYHKSFGLFSCNIPGCTVSCGTVYEYDQHYNSCHRFSCSQCNKYLPSAHLLDLHLMEVHDAYFAALAEKKAMFQCYVKECKTVFQTPQFRRDHCIKEHKFPSNFRFDDCKKKKNAAKGMRKSKKENQDVEMSENIKDDVKMDVSHESNVQKVKSTARKGGNYSSKRKPVLDLDCFVKDLKESLPN
ncbi:UNVERIFIED_CONTAM: hypothetical protein PYX00_001855 [Menopon gallinae]|uniref:C2H2-type domain-containing protein n=1 Tax=Menopon gallinae TaxID=328185 RepID=A0AAW2IG74_9NEOP